MPAYITTGASMADESQKQTVSLEELMVSNLAMTEAAVKLYDRQGRLY